MSKVKTLAIQLLVGVVLLEILLRCLYFQKLGNDTLAILSAYKSVEFRANDTYKARLVKNNNLLRPDSAKVNEKIVNEVIASNAFEYTPWVDFRLKDFAGKYVNSKGFVRKSIPSVYINPDKPATKKIFLFGGSTMFGFDVTDKETIASSLADIYQHNCSSCSSVEVFNYGVLSYHSYNELMLLNHLFSTGSRPDVVVFLDGLNDLFMFQAARERVPWFYFRLKENIQNVKDSTLSLFQLREGQTNETAAGEVVTNYLSNVDHIRRMCASYNTNALFFIQPNPYYHYPNQQKDPVADTSENKLIHYGYDLLKDKCDTSAGMYFLGNMLENEKDLPFIDEIHYSPSMNKKIAREIFIRLSTLEKLQ